MLDQIDATSPVNLADPVNRHHPLNRGRAAWWLVVPGIDGGRQWFDLIGASHGTLAGMTAAGSGWYPSTRPGGTGAIRSTSGSTFVNLGPIPALNGSAWSIATWVFLEAHTGLKQSILGSSNNGNARIMVYEWGGADKIWLGEEAVTTGISAPMPYATYGGTWARVLWSYTAGTPKCYINGVATTTSGAFTSSATAYTGNYFLGNGNGNSNFAGQADDLSVWSRTLSADEARADHDLSRRGYPGVLDRMGAYFAGTTAPLSPTGPADDDFFWNMALSL